MADPVRDPALAREAVRVPAESQAPVQGRARRRARVRVLVLVACLELAPEAAQVLALELGPRAVAVIWLAGPLAAQRQCNR
jgi:hypothetical protein